MRNLTFLIYLVNIIETLSALLASALRMVGVGALVGLVGGSSTAEHMIDAKAVRKTDLHEQSRLR